MFIVHKHIPTIINIKHRICAVTSMTHNNPVSFDLIDNTHVVVRELAKDKYDFEMLLPNGSRKTFIWAGCETSDFCDKKGRADILIHEAVNQFTLILKPVIA